MSAQRSLLPTSRRVSASSTSTTVDPKKPTKTQLINATRAILEQQHTGALESLAAPSRMMRGMVEAALDVEEGRFSRQPYKGFIRGTAEQYIRELYARLGVRAFRDELGQCNACGSWVKVANLTVHRESRCKAADKKADAKFWVYVADGGDSEEVGEEDGGL